MKKLLVIFLLILSFSAARAVDFRLRQYDGGELCVSSLTTEYTLVLLYNSDCDLCTKAAAELRGSKTINRLIRRNRLTVVTVAMFEDGDDWKVKASTFSPEWLNCTDAFDDLLEGDALDFNTVPSYFLLDKEHNVILSNASLKKVERFLKRR